MQPFLPTIGATLVVDMPGERLAATVQDIVTDDVVLIELTAQPLMRSHFYKRGDVLWCRRARTMLGEKWEVLDRRPEIEEAPKPRPKRKPKADRHVVL